MKQLTASASDKPTFKMFLRLNSLGAFLVEQGYGSDVLSLIDAPFGGSWKTAVYWAIFSPDKDLAIAVNRVGTATCGLTVITSSEKCPVDYWRDAVLSPLKNVRIIDRLYLTQPLAPTRHAMLGYA